MTKLLTVLALLAGISPAMAEAPKLTVAQCLSLLSGLKNLDGRVVVVKDASVVVPWDFASGALRLRIANNISALAVVETTIETARQSIIKELLAKMPPDAPHQVGLIQAGTPEFESFSRQFADALAQPCTASLVRIKASDLRLDKNEIPGTALSALAPILDDDVSK